MKKTRQDWENHKTEIMSELAHLQSLNWAADEEVSSSIFPYVLIEALNILENSEFREAITDHASNGKDAKELLKRNS